MTDAKQARAANRWPDAKLRRSNIDWYSLVPAEIADDQVRWEKTKTVCGMRSAGMTYAQIGDAFGVAGETVRIWIAKDDRLDRYYRRDDKRSPAEIWLACDAAVAESAKKIRGRKKTVAALSGIKVINAPSLTVKRDWMHV